VGAEISARVELAMQPAISFGAAALIAFLASIALTMAVGFGLGELVGIPLGFLAAGVLYLGLAYLLFLWGKSRMRRMKRIQVSRRDARPDADWAPES
jgi:protein-S-isoprenylcysteine O-methyltransferase Ste14